MLFKHQITKHVFRSVLSGDVPRVNGQLAVSRAFGDKSLKAHLRSDPDVKDSSIDDHTDVLVLASDGLWKVNNGVHVVKKLVGVFGLNRFDV